MKGERGTYHVGIHDQRGRDPIPFAPAKDGDVGHDLGVIISKNEMSWFDRFIAFLIRSKKPMYIIWPFKIRSLRSGLHVVMKSNLWCEVKARSSTSRRKMTVIGGNIDSGYRGELFTILHNVGFLPRIIRHGERYSQVIFHRAIRPVLHPMTKWDFHEIANVGRGSTGFGSTGK